MTRVVLTGASGFLGGHLATRLRGAGFEVVGLARDPVQAARARPELEWFRFALGGVPEPAAWGGGGAVLVHAAYEPAVGRSAWHLNVDGTRRLLADARAHGVERTVFISSMSAHDAAESEYGRAKLACEALLDLSRDAAVRPGFIIGAGGIFERLAKMLRLLPVVPLFYGGQQQLHTIAIDDLTLGLQRVLERRTAGLVLLGERAPVALRDFYEAVARAQGTHPRFVPVPGAPALLAFRLSDRLGLPLPFSAENLRGLKALRAFDVGPTLDGLGLDPRHMRDSVRDHFHR